MKLPQAYLYFQQLMGEVFTIQKAFAVWISSSSESALSNWPVQFIISSGTFSCPS